MLIQETILLRKQFLSETVFGYLKNKLQLEHMRHHSSWNAFIHLISTLIAYQLKFVTFIKKYDSQQSYECLNWFSIPLLLRGLE